MFGPELYRFELAHIGGIHTKRTFMAESSALAWAQVAAHVGAHVSNPSVLSIHLIEKVRIGDRNGDIAMVDAINEAFMY